MSIYRTTVIAEHTASGAQFNIHHYEFPGYVPTETELEEFAQNIADIYEEQASNIFSSSVVFSEIELRRVDVGDQPSSTFVPTGWPITGSQVGSSLPAQCSMVLRWNAPTTFPRSGRTYLPTSSTGALTAGGRLTSGMTAIGDAMALALEEIPVTGQVDAQKVAVRYGGDPVAVVASNILFARPTSTVFGIQRRRRPGTGI